MRKQGNCPTQPQVCAHQKDAISSRPCTVPHFKNANYRRLITWHHGVWEESACCVYLQMAAISKRVKTSGTTSLFEKGGTS